MTGGEIAAAAALAGKVVTHAGKELAEDSKSLRKELLEQAKDTPEFAEGARQLAKRIAIRQEILTNFYKPIARLFGVANHYFESDFGTDMAAKLANVPEEDLVAPKASLAAPAMQQLGYSLDEPDLKEMYLNLLAAASDKHRSSSAHPSFVEVIKQLSSEETVLLNKILTCEKFYTPIVNLIVKTTKGWQVGASHVLRIDDEVTGHPTTLPNSAMFVANWIRLGLVEVRYGTSVSEPGAYDWVDQRPEMLARNTHPEQDEDKKIQHEKGVINPTPYGMLFRDAVGIGHQLNDSSAPGFVR